LFFRLSFRLPAPAELSNPATQKLPVPWVGALACHHGGNEQESKDRTQSAARRAWDFCLAYPEDLEATLSRTAPVSTRWVWCQMNSCQFVGTLADQLNALCRAVWVLDSCPGLQMSVAPSHRLRSVKAFLRIIAARANQQVPPLRFSSPSGMRSSGRDDNLQSATETM